MTWAGDFLSDDLVIYKKDKNLAQDFNGDGLTDLVGIETSGINGTEYKRWIALSDGNGGFTETHGDAVLPSDYEFFGEYDALVSGDFDGNGMPDIMSMSYYHWSNDRRWVGLNNNEIPRLEKVTQGYQSPTVHGVVTEIEYLPLTDTNIYVKGSGAVFPIRDIISPTYVVSTLTKDNGQEGTYCTDYSYGVGRYHVNGRGFLGFQQFESYDQQTKLSYVETLAHDFPFTGRATKTETFYIPNPAGDPQSPGYSQSIKLVENNWIFDLVNGGTLFAFNPKSTETKWELGQPNTPVSNVSTWNWFDLQDTSQLPPTGQPTSLYAKITHGNLTQNIIDYGGGLKQTTINSYDDWDDSSHWLLGRLDTSSVTHESTGQADVVRSSSFDYDAVSGLLSQETIEPGDAQFELVTDYYYDGFGNITNKTLTPAGLPSRTVLSDSYDAKGRFVESSRNTLDHETTFINDQATGKPLSSTDPNNLTTQWLYDETGRAVSEELPDGTVTTNTYIWNYTTVSVPAGPGSPSNVAQKSAYKLHSETDGAPPVTTWFDKQGREIRVQTLSADGSPVNKDTGYNAIALPIAVSEPYFETGGTPVYTFTEYDGLGRPQYVTAPDGTVSEQVYNGLSSQAIVDSNHRTTGTPAAKHQITTTVKNTKGEVLSVTDATMTNTVTYTYDPVGNMTRTVDPESNTIEMDYDLRGNKIGQDDPDMGVWFYTYNALDQLTSQTDANGNVIETAYDLLGRATARTNQVMKTAGLELEGTAKWIYDGTGEGAKLGTLRREEHRDRLGRFINRKTYAYDQYSRPMLELRNYDSKWFYTTVQYDLYSRVEVAGRFWRPAGMEGVEHQLSPTWNSFATTNSYNTYGALLEVRDDINNVWWSCGAGDYDEYGRLVRFEYGNGLATTNHFNSLTGRMEGIGIIDGVLGVAEYGFEYDRIGSLTDRSLSRDTTTLTETCAYDALNRLLSSSISGPTNYTVSSTYDVLGNIKTKTGISGTYLYGQNGAGPHAVTTAGDREYFYDNNGNIIRRDQNSQYEFTANWNSFNKPTSLFAGLDGSEFEYDVNGQRTQQLIFEDGGVRKKIYVAETYEMEERLVNTNETDRALWQWEPVHSRIYVDTPAGRVGIYEQAASTNGTGAVTQSWLHKDHLGSVVAVSDTSANIVHYSYDAWGNRRDASDWSPIAGGAASLSTVTDRGYTGHEQLDHLQLVHMNGRIYDPVIGRMISSDPLIQAPENLQSFNRYSYVMNRPLSLTDPSGFVSSGLEKVLGASFGGGGGSSAPKMVMTLRTAIQSGLLSAQDAIALINAGMDLNTVLAVEDWMTMNQSTGSYEVHSASIMSDVPIARPHSGGGESSLDFGSGGGGYGLGTGNGRIAENDPPSPPSTGLNANDVELGKGDWIQANASAGSSSASSVAKAAEGGTGKGNGKNANGAVTKAIDFIAGTDWGKKPKGTEIVNALRDLNAAGDIVLKGQKDAKDIDFKGDKSWLGAYKGGKITVYTDKATGRGERLNGSDPEVGDLALSLVHEGQHRVDHLNGVYDPATTYGLKQEVDAYNTAANFYNESRTPTAAPMNKFTEKQISEMYRGLFTGK